MGGAFHTQIEVDVPAQRAWSVLTDFASFPQWSPTLRRVDGQARVGAPLGLRVALQPGGNRTLPLQARVRVFTPERELAWGGGVPGAAWLLDVHHYFRLEPLGPGRTRLRHGEEFRGILIAPLWPLIERRAASGYDAFNAAFKQRCEARP